MYPSHLKGMNSTVLSYSQTWMTAATHSEFSIKSNFCLKDIPTSPGLCFDEEKSFQHLPTRHFISWFLRSSQLPFKNMGNGTSCSNTHVANATGKHLRIFYGVDTMRLEEMVVNAGGEIGGTASKTETSASGKISTDVKTVFKPDSRIRYLRLPKYETCNFAGEGAIYASVLVEDENNNKNCTDVICLNYHVPSDRSFIVTANHNIKLQKYGESIWVDEDGNHHHP